MTDNFVFERTLEKKLRANKWLIPLAGFLMAGILFTGICLCMAAFKHQYYWVVIPAGFLVHAFFIVLVHDGAHKAITRTKADYFIMNAAAGLMLLPFYGELFRKYHLTHHAHTNALTDPLWPEYKKMLYQQKRWLYILCELVPLAFTLLLLWHNRAAKTKKWTNQPAKSPPVRIPYIILSALISAILFWWAWPPVWFLAGTLLTINIITLLRHWCEHMGTTANKESNTYWFPLGMGIGNHEVHHCFPHFSWLTLMIGLYIRKTDTNPFKALTGILFNRSFSHYQPVKETAPKPELV